MKKAYSDFICWKEKLYNELFRALNQNDKSVLIKREQARDTNSSK